MRLFEIANEYQMLLDQTFDSDSDEVNPEALDNLNKVEDTLKNKSIAVAAYIRNIDAERQAIEDAKKAMADRETRLKKRVAYLTSYLQSNMERCGIKEISCAQFLVKLKLCPVSVDVIDETIIPDTYKKRIEEISIDKIKIKEDILNNIVIPGASLKQNIRLEIR